MLESYSRNLRLAGIERDPTVNMDRDHIDECGTPLAPTSDITNAGEVPKR